jgi:hypothetical protein
MRFPTRGRSKWHQVLIGNTRSADISKTMHGSLEKPCIVLIVSVDLAVFWTITQQCHFFSLK